MRRARHWSGNRRWTLTGHSCFLFQEVDSMRSAYYSDLCSKFMIENTILKMEYAEVRVFSISDKVGSGWLKKNIHRMFDPATWSPEKSFPPSCFSNRTWPPYVTWTSCYWLPISICRLISCSSCRLSLPCCSAWRWCFQSHLAVLHRVFPDFAVCSTSCFSLGNID